MTRMNAYEKLQTARSQTRPTARAYIEKLFQERTELHGDRKYADDAAIIGGIGMLGGIGNSMILGNFDATFAAHPEMALYIPLIGGTGGNVGTQSSAIIVQGLANNSLDAKDTFKQITKESVVALINATIISLLVYIYNFVRFGATATVTYSVSISLFAVVMFASIFGTLVPMTLEKLKVDPAIATGPFIAITNDIIGMMLYMGITVLLS